MQQISQNKIKKFWGWFIMAANNFGKQFKNEELIRELDQKIEQLGDIAWEIGPGVVDSNNNALVFTPCGNKDLLPITKLIVENAPYCSGWEFFSSKPPKKWKRYFTMEDDKGDEVEIDASNWQYAMIKYKDGIFDIIIQAPELSQYSEDFKYIAAAIVIDGEIGEEKRLNWIEGIEVVEEFDNDLREKSNSIDVLTKHFNGLIIE